MVEQQRTISWRGRILVPKNMFTASVVIVLQIWRVEQVYGHAAMCAIDAAAVVVVVVVVLIL